MEFIDFILILGGVMAGIVNTISGSGTLFSLGTMALMDIPLNIANITTRPGVLLQNLTGILVLKKHKEFSFAEFSLGPLISALIGALIGSVAAVYIPNDAFVIIASLVMLFLLIQNLAGQRKVFKLKVAGKHSKLFQYIMFFLSGIYGGFIHIGIGILILSICIGTLSMTYVKANAFKLLIILIYTLPTTLYFAYMDTILWYPAILIGLGQIVGAYIAATFITRNKNAAEWARWITIVMIFITLLKVWLFPS